MKLKNMRQHRSSEKPEMNKDIEFICGSKLSQKKRTSVSSKIVQNTGRTTKIVKPKEKVKRK